MPDTFDNPQDRDHRVQYSHIPAPHEGDSGRSRLVVERRSHRHENFAYAVYPVRPDAGEETVIVP